MRYIEISIHKPLFSNFVYIRSKYIDQARRLNIPLKITIPQGTAIATADEWMKGSKKMVKEYLIKGSPMTLWGNYVPLEDKSFNPRSKPSRGLLHQEQLSLI